MTVEVDAIWLNEHYEVTFGELSERSGLAVEQLAALIECGAVSPRRPAGDDYSQWRFGAEGLSAARAASRLRRDFELDINGVMLALALLQRIDALKAELQEMRARLVGPD